MSVIIERSLPPTTWTHSIALQLEILPNNKVLVPGAEPTSDLSSRVLGAYLARQGFGSALVDVMDVLKAIPGSTLKYGINFNRGGYRQKWLVLPPYEPNCPCIAQPDYYKILKSLANTEIPLEESFDSCDLNGMGNCPHPDFKLDKPPDPYPYKAEGSFPAAGGVLPPLPAWAGGEYPSVG